LPEVITPIIIYGLPFTRNGAEVGFEVTLMLTDKHCLPRRPKTIVVSGLN
jgi:hypothetical protein